ncbi:12704_t:CDS:2 [Cetraspora pellucida]|uniref:12704_t:CDS:1 n=1 Tax=Cetraspora pellucida TaxID=1433469 RepID=A0ACA9JX38_9GLOM|nr:12704_t:CDS:2 [Cetraspora pellucida]
MSTKKVTASRSSANRARVTSNNTQASSSQNLGYYHSANVMSTTADGSYASFLFHGDVFPSSKSLSDQVVDEIVSILKKEAEERNKKKITSEERSAAAKLNQVSNLLRQYVAKDVKAQFLMQDTLINI